VSLYFHEVASPVTRFGYEVHLGVTHSNVLLNVTITEHLAKGITDVPFVTRPVCVHWV
jgi:hypothetical protein